jgi:hypothetical protein
MDDTLSKELPPPALRPPDKSPANRHHHAFKAPTDAAYTRRNTRIGSRTQGYRARVQSLESIELLVYATTCNLPRRTPVAYVARFANVSNCQRTHPENRVTISGPLSRVTRTERTNDPQTVSEGVSGRLLIPDSQVRVAGSGTRNLLASRGRVTISRFLDRASRLAASFSLFFVRPASRSKPPQNARMEPTGIEPATSWLQTRRSPD